MNLPTLYEIEDEMQKVSDADIERAMRELDPVAPGEEKLGEIFAPSLHRLWALAYRLMGESIKAGQRAKFEASSKIESEELMIEAVRYSRMSELCRTIFWAEARAHVGGSAWAEGSIGMRAGFILTKTADEKQNTIAKMFGLGG